MPLLMEREPDRQSHGEIHLAAPAGSRLDPNGDGTRELLLAGGGTLIAGVIAALLTKFVFGGIGIQGPHTNSGWLSLLVAMGCLPFGVLLSLLGFAKWLRNRRTGRRD